MNRQTRQGLQNLLGPLYPPRHESLLRIHDCIGELARAEAPQQRVGLEACTVACLTGRVGAIAREQYAHMHLVRTRLEPLEEPLDAVPDSLGPLALTFDHPIALRSAQIAPWRVEGNVAFLRELDQIFLALGIRLRLPGLHRAAAQRLALIRNDQPVVDSDRTTETAAALARTHR